jgi:hypothetical protein
MLKHLTGTHRVAPLAIEHLDDFSNYGFQSSSHTMNLLLILHFLDASTALVWGNIHAADPALALTHTRVNIDVPQSDEQWSIGRADEPTPDLPDQVQEDQEGSSKVKLEEVLGVQVGATDRVQGGVELSDQGENIDQDAEV